MAPNMLGVGGVGTAGDEEVDDLLLLDDLQELLGGSQGQDASPLPPPPAAIQLTGPAPVPHIPFTHTARGPQPASSAAVGASTMLSAAAMAAKAAAAGQAPPASTTPVQSAFASAQGSMVIGALADVLPPVHGYSQQPGAGAAQQPGQRQQRQQPQQPQQLPMRTQQQQQQLPTLAQQQQQQPELQQGHVDWHLGGHTVSSAPPAAASVAPLSVAATVAPVSPWVLTAEGSGRLYSQGSSVAPGAAVHDAVRTGGGGTAVPPHEAALQAAVEAEQALLLGDAWVRPPEPAKVSVWWCGVCGTYGLTWNKHAQCQLSKAELRYLFNGLEVGVGLPEPARQLQSLQPTCPGHTNTTVPPVVASQSVTSGIPHKLVLP